MPIAIITGASRGLGLALARALAQRGWALVLDARGAADLEQAARELDPLTEVVAIPGDVADAHHRHALVEAAGEAVDLLVNNASVLGPSPQPLLADYDLGELERVYRINFNLDQIPVTNRFVLEILSPEGERLTRFHFDLL